ncbi:hypothetical protein BYT27DRAFT_7173045 [Phlegmacium glaucopus]|nr:hypothetical protein BYT27DRAFT_7173045 [Phlegmacium glaucopus]
MHFGSLFTTAFSLAAYSIVVASARKSGENNTPGILATAAFSDANTFNHVVNGEKSSLMVTVENKSDRNVTLLNIAGALLHPDTNAVLKNLTILKYGVALVEKAKLQLPYTFHSEFRPGDHRLNVWVEHTTEGEKQRVEAYDSIVTIVEPEISIFDLKLLSTYAIVAAFLGGLCYLAYSTFAPQSKKSRSKKAPAVSVSSSVSAVTATGAGGYQEEWIPEHHLRKSKSSKKQAGAASGTSGDELSPTETSGTEGKRRKGKK